MFYNVSSNILFSWIILPNDAPIPIVLLPALATLCRDFLGLISSTRCHTRVNCQLAEPATSIQTIEIDTLE